RHTRSTRDWSSDVCSSDLEIVGWWTDCNTAGIGIVTGRLSRVVALDVDGSEGEASLARMESEHGQLPATAVQRTGRGRHLLFRRSEERRVGKEGRPGWSRA